MTLDEFYSLCPIELDAIFDSYEKDERERKEWERLLTYILFAAHAGSENVKSPKELIEFPWEEEEMPMSEYQRLLDRIDTLNKEGRAI